MIEGVFDRLVRTGWVGEGRMAERRVIVVSSVLGALLAATGCDLEAEDGLEAVESFDQLRKGECGGGTWIGNGLVDPDVGDVDPAHGLDTLEGLDPDSAGLELATYLVECALPDGDMVTKTVQGQALELHGALGLAPEWKHGACDEDCQEWVSACLLARVNVTGQSVDLWLAADHPAIGLGHDDVLSTYEATFYGNLFAEPHVRSLCRGPYGGSTGDQLDDRTCGGQPLEDCGFTDWGACRELERCSSVQGFAVDCATGGDPAAGARYHSISTFVNTEGW